MISLRLTNLMIKRRQPALIFLKGLPGSGKSTFAKSLSTQFRNTIVVSKDQIRKDMWEEKFPDIPWKKNMNDGWRPSESSVLAERDRRMLSALREGKNVIIDDTNFNPIHEENIRKLVKDIAIFEVVEIDTPLSECVERDKNRPPEEQVGAMVIHAMYNRYLKGSTENGRNGNGNGRPEGDPEPHDGEIRQSQVRGDSEPLRGTEKGVGRDPEAGSESSVHGRRSEGQEGPSLGKDKVSTGRQRRRTGYPEDRERDSLGNSGRSERKEVRRRTTTTTTGAVNDEVSRIPRDQLNERSATDPANGADSSGRSGAHGSHFNVHLLQSSGPGAIVNDDNRVKSGGTEDSVHIQNVTNPQLSQQSISFGVAASKFLNWRKTFVGKEELNGWKKNSRGIWEFSWDAPTYNMQGQFVGVLKVYYADQNPMGKSREAQMILGKKWLPHEAGWMWINFRGRRIWLGKATPEGNESVRTGKIVAGHDGRKHFFIAF